MICQPLGVAAVIAFQLPGHDPVLVYAHAVACGNTYIVKPSEKVPLTMQDLALIEQAGFPKGVINLVNGASETVDAILITLLFEQSLCRIDSGGGTSTAGRLQW
jgi:malonate-semialdehyde dehydrogenase (acetylating)/methylmalonate-semialdehyde dehydrogenase